MDLNHNFPTMVQFPPETACYVSHYNKWRLSLFWLALLCSLLPVTCVEKVQILRSSSSSHKQANETERNEVDGVTPFDKRMVRTHDEARCIVEHPGWIGDGYCDPIGGYNTRECGWDGGDCCAPTCVSSDMSLCYCLETSAVEVRTCYGYFCEEYIDTMFILMTHNSFAVPWDVSSPSQTFNELTQFNDGIRGFSMDIYENDDGNIIMKHGPLSGEVDYTGRVSEILNEMNKEGNEYEFVLIQYEDYIDNYDAVNRVCDAWGDKLITNFDSNKKLGEYLSQGKQVLLTTNKDSNVDPSRGMHAANLLIVENDYTWESAKESPAMSYRRGPDSPQVQPNRYAKMMNYFCTGALGIGSKRASATVNTKAKMQCHAQEFKKQPYAQNTINIMMIDYYDQGDPFEGQTAIRNDETIDEATCLEQCEKPGTDCKFPCTKCCNRDHKCPWFGVFGCTCVLSDDLSICDLQ